MGPGRLVALHRKRKQRIPRLPDQAAVAGVGVQHPVHDDRPAAVQRATLCLAAIDCWEFANSIRLTEGILTFTL